MGILPHAWICNVVSLLISWTHYFTESYLSDTDNIALFENTTPINLLNLLCVLLFWSFYFGLIVGVFENTTSNGTLSVWDKYDSVNEHTQEISESVKLHILGI